MKAILGALLVIFFGVAVSLAPPAERAITALAASSPTVLVFLPETHGAIKVATVPGTATATSTATRTATATSTATTSPTATSTQAAGNVSLIGATSVYSSFGSLWIYGEVKNTTASYVQFVKVTVNLFNGQQLVKNDFTFTYLDKLAPNEKTCFAELLLNAPAWTNYTFEQPTYSAVANPNLNIAYVGPAGSVSSASSYQIIGQMRNDGGSVVKFVKSIATLYDVVGVPIGCDYTYVNSTDLNPGQTSSFTHMASHSPDVPVSTYRLQPNGSPQ